MDRTLRQHIQELESRVRRLTEKSMENQLSLIERNRIESEIRAANLALSHFKAALVVEESLGLTKT